jgi:hypothetical protein
MRPCYCCNKFSNNKVLELELSLVNSIELDNKLEIYKCDDCYFYYNSSKNVQDDYDNYYKTNNNYKLKEIIDDKDKKCADYLIKKLDSNIHNIIDYGAGNCILAKLLSEKFNVDTYDIGESNINKKYNCIVLSHVLEHIYDIDSFILNLIPIINDNGYIYIEIPNAEYYDELRNFGILQEINVEHINYFSKYALSKLMIKHNFIPISIEDDYYLNNNSKYYVIRGIFKMLNNNKSFENYINNGINELELLNIPENRDVYIYGCGQFLYKILNKIKEKCNIINIIDDNTCFINKKINNIYIINFNEFEQKVKSNDNVMIITKIYSDLIKKKLKNINKKINIIPLFN